MRVYTVTVPLAGTDEGYPVAECREVEHVVALVRALLMARTHAPDKVVVQVRDELVGPPPF